MTLEFLQQEMVAAMKSGDKTRKSVLSVAIAQIKSAAIDEGCRDDIPETLVNKMLTKAKKTCREMVTTCPEERPDLLENYKLQFEIISEYAPALITDPGEIKQFIIDSIEAEKIVICKENRGMIMKALAANLRGRADMSEVNRIVGEMLQ